MNRNQFANEDFRKAAITVSIAWVILQIILLVIYWNHPEVPDARSYCRQALESVQEGTMYPSLRNVNDLYIHAPGLLLIISLFINRRKIISESGVILIITALAFGYSMVSIAELRFHYTFIFVIVLSAAYGVETLLEKRRVCN
jgi:hypothetical protein